MSRGGGATGPVHAGDGGGDNNECNNAYVWYRDLHVDPSEWGEQGGNEEQTDHVLCCWFDADKEEKNDED